MNTLVIHPDNRSTDFLKVIYEGKDYTVLQNREQINRKLLTLNLIKNHDRIIMMGHGGPYGLVGHSSLFMNPYIIKELRKKECVCIWCHANIYVEREGLRGFYTGMFISEMCEANFYGIWSTQERITYSNNLFSGLMRDMIDNPNILTEIKQLYIGDCPVIVYNNERLYYKPDNAKTRREVFGIL
jgi:hypothetical protein